MVKRILKKIFPTPFLKEAFLLYNKFRIVTIDKLIFPEFVISKDQFLLYRVGYPFRENRINVDSLVDPKVRSYMQSWDTWTQEEFILVFKNTCWIEPEYGWAVTSPVRLIYYSLGISRAWSQRKPDLMKFLRRKNPAMVPRAISLRDSGEENYGHFYNDLLTKIFFLRKSDFLLANTPIIISKKLWDRDYFQYYLSHSPYFQSLQWLVQDKQYIQCAEVIFCKPLTHRLDLLQEAIAPIRLPGGGERKIFLTRSKARLRYLENEVEIGEVCMRHGFELVDTDLLSQRQEIEIFANAAWVIGIHGAGLSNILFRTGQCHVLEIFPPPDLGYLPFHYIMLAGMLGFRYQALIGEKNRKRYSGGFYFPPELFESELRKFLQG